MKSVIDQTSLCKPAAPEYLDRWGGRDNLKKSSNNKTRTDREKDSIFCTSDPITCNSSKQNPCESLSFIGISDYN